MKTRIAINQSIALAGLIIALLPTAALAAPGKSHSAKTAPTMYECQTCHMKYTAAQAKNDHYKDPMDGGKLVPVKAAAKPASAKPAKMIPPKGAISM